MSSMTIFLNFWPVQEFVTQARRTRDLWAGSYFLSYLAASALAEAERQGAEIVLPEVAANPLFQAVRDSKVPVAPGDRVGSIPHVAELAAPNDRAESIAKEVISAWSAAWLRVADVVAKEFPNLAAPSRVIWDRQVAGVWSHLWILGDPANMARRKTLRSFALSPEPGEKCTCCGVRECLHDGGSRVVVRQFWSEAAASVNGKLKSGEILVDGTERLCAICAIKRLYPHLSRSALGWDVPTGFPSTDALASIPWRLKVLEAGKESREVREAVKRYMATLVNAGIPKIRALKQFKGLVETAKSWPDDRQIASDFLEYDGDWFYPDEARSAILEQPYTTDPSMLTGALRDLHSSLRRAGIAGPGTAYALLAMDGDRMGTLLRDHPREKGKISRALMSFSQQAVEIVEGPQANGYLVYAGGDDVLALLPSDTALDTADRLRIAYQQAFHRGLGVQPTISAGLVYAHMHAPLQQVTLTARRALEGGAKEHAKRNAVGIAVWKRPGVVLQLACKWNDNGKSFSQTINDVRGGIRKRQFSRGFLYSLRDILEITKDVSPEDEQALLVAEYLKSRARSTTRQQAEERVALLQQLYRWSGAGIDAVLLATFLEGGD